MKDLLKKMGFCPKENTKGIFIKKYPIFENYVIEVDFENEKFDFGEKIAFESATTQNFSQAENWVILECIDRLLTKGYKPENITLEKIYPSGHGTSGRLDILVKKNNKAYLMIECKTRGKEFEKEFAKLKKDGGQLFTYFQQDTNAEHLILYTSSFINNEIKYKNEIIKIEEDYRQAGNVKDLYERWNKLTKQNGIFDERVNIYEFQSKALTREELEVIKQEDSSFIFNRFLEILRKNVVSDKPNAFNKIFTLFLCKIIDEDRPKNEQLHFQWLEGEDDNISFQKRLTDLYKRGMKELLEKEITDLSDDDFEMKFGAIEESQKREFLKILTEIRLKKNNEFAFKEVFDNESFEENAKVVKDVVELLQKYQLRYNKKQQYLGDFFELLLTTGLKQESGQFFTPVPIAKYIIKSLPIHEIINKKISNGNPNDLLPNIIDYAAGSGHFITESMEEVQDFIETINEKALPPKSAKKIKSWKEDQFDRAFDYIYGIEKDYRLVKTAKVSCYLHGDGLAKIIHADGLGTFDKTPSFRGKLKEIDHDFRKDNKQFDIVISNPPYSVSAFKGTLNENEAKEDFELFNKLTDQSSEIECLFIERTKHLLKDDGVAGIILPSSILNKEGINTLSREMIFKYFEIIGITELGSNTFMATGKNTVILFLKRRNNYEWLKIENSIKKFFTNFQDITINSIENIFSNFVNYVREGLSFPDYLTLCKETPNETVQEHEIFIEYKNKLKTDNKEDLYKQIVEIEKEKILYFILAQKQKVVLTKTGEKKQEKQFLGYEFSNRRGHEGIHAIRKTKTIEECTTLFDGDTKENPEKANFYIYKNFIGQDFNIHENIKKNITIIDLIDLMTFDMADFQKTISLSEIKNIKIDSKRKQDRISNSIVIINGKKIAEAEILKDGKIPVITQEKNELISGYSNENGEITDIPVILFGDHSCVFKYINFKFFRGADGTILLKPNKNFYIKYFFYFLECIAIELIHNKNKYERHWKYLKNVKIPIPPEDIQKKIIKEIEELEKKADKEVIKDLQEQKKSILLKYM